MKCKNCNENEAIKYSKYSKGEFCCKKCAMSYSTKNRRYEINIKVSKKLKKNADKFCKTCGVKLNRANKLGFCINHMFTEEYKTLLRHKKSNSVNMGGLRNGGGKSKVFKYVNNLNEQMMLNKDEIIVAKCLDNLKLDWHRNWKGFEYIDENGKRKKYYPDFYVDNFDYYVEYKGWVTQKINHKMSNALENNNFKLLIIYSNDKRYRDLGLNLEQITNNNNLIIDNITKFAP
jgi:hypothetical protein